MKLATTILVFCVGSLLALGLVMLYSSSMVQVGARFLMMQSIWCALGLVACGVAASIDYQWLKKYAWVFYGVALFMLVLVLVPHIGLKVNGARRWFGFGPVRFQPSEFAKIAMIIALAAYVDRYQRSMHKFREGLLIPGLFAGAMLGLVFVEPDRGSTILLAGVVASMLLIAGVRWKFFLPPVFAAIGALTISILHDPMRMKRIFSWLYLEENKQGVGYQAYQAMIALGSGGWFGLGLGNGRQKLGFVPEHHTDFILSIIGEELGLVATLFVVLAFIVLVVCGVYIAWRSRDTFGRLLAAGITFMIGMQAFINIGVVTSSLPNKGISLPFISYGGSSLLMMLVSVGLLLSVARQGVDSTVNEAEHFGNTELPVSQLT